MNNKSVKLLSLMLSAMMMIVAIPMGVMAEFGGTDAEVSSDLNAGKNEYVSEGESVSGEDASEEDSTGVVPTTEESSSEIVTVPTTEAKSEEVSTVEPASDEETTGKEEESKEPTTADYLIMGDLNNDGKVTAEDARIALRIAAKLENASAYQMKVGDLNKDGKISAMEARYILRFAAKLDAVLQGVI